MTEDGKLPGWVGALLVAAVVWWWDSNHETISAWSWRHPRLTLFVWSWLWSHMVRRRPAKVLVRW